MISGGITTQKPLESIGNVEENYRNVGVLLTQYGHCCYHFQSRRFSWTSGSCEGQQNCNEEQKGTLDKLTVAAVALVISAFSNLQHPQTYSILKPAAVMQSRHLICSRPVLVYMSSFQPQQSCCLPCLPNRKLVKLFHSFARRQGTPVAVEHAELS